MPQPTRPAGPKKGPAKGKAAVAETTKQDAPRTVEYRGLELTVKPVGSELMWLLGDLEGDDASQFAVSQKMLRELIGPDQMGQVREKQATDGVSFNDAVSELSDLFNRILEQAGTDLGESPASPAS